MPFNEMVSIIVPVYKTEKYLDRCLLSLINQTYTNIEILLIDDGSPDESPKMCDEWAEKDDRVRVVHKKNGGLGSARNSGLEVANGEYVCFCDSDDYLDIDAVKVAHEVIAKTDLDMVCYGLILYDELGRPHSTVSARKEETFIGKDQIRENFIPRMVGTNPYTGESIGLWMSLDTCLIKKKLLTAVGWRCRSERDVISEDMLSLLELYDSLESVAVIPNALYHYEYNGNSLSHVYRKDRFEKIKHFYSLCKKVCDEKDYSDIVKKEIDQQLLLNSISILKQIVKSEGSIYDKTRFIRTILADTELQTVLQKSRYDRFDMQKKILFALMRIRAVSPVFIMIKVKLLMS